jgi:pimeloyl-ACP methyl ester carboxylesterase
MSFVTTIDGTRIFYKDWGSKTVQPTVFSHGWPLCSDEARILQPPTRRRGWRRGPQSSGSPVAFHLTLSGHTAAL